MTTREHIVATATDMFISQGIRSVRMDDIARQCGVSKRTIYEIFKDREELIGESMRHHAIQSHTQSEQVAEGAENVLHAFWLTFTNGNRFCKGNNTIIDELRRYYPQVMEQLMIDIHEAVVAHTRDKLSEGVADGLIISDLDLDFFSRALTNYVYGLGIISANTHTTGVVITDQTMPTAVLVFLRGISTEKGRRYIDENLLINNK
ncbi:MAG: TetR/AcrR family transcriptional regulator [Rikenellaceae bacterium]|nr:TetR/AcrR family transcriptional regulator [Rikenellaceae bacterium]